MASWLLVSADWLELFCLLHYRSSHCNGLAGFFHDLRIVAVQRFQESKRRQTRKQKGARAVVTKKDVERR